MSEGQTQEQEPQQQQQKQQQQQQQQQQHEDEQKTADTTESRDRKNTLETKEEPKEVQKEETKEETKKEEKVEAQPKETKKPKQVEPEPERPDTVRDDTTGTKADKSDSTGNKQNEKSKDTKENDKKKQNERENEKSKGKLEKDKENERKRQENKENKGPSRTRQRPVSLDSPAQQTSKQNKRPVSLDSPRTQSTRPGTETSEGRRKQKEFFKLELSRLESGLKRESSKIHAPPKKAHTPFVFNTLEPYYNTYTTRYLIDLPDEVKHGHSSRSTAQGLTDPWNDLKMDRDILPPVQSKPVSRQVAILKKEKEIRDRKKRSAMTQSSSSRKFEGSTRLPKFPVVNLETQDLATKQLYYSDVPALRHELKTKYSSSAKTKIDADYKRTQQDFYRMELDKLDQVHPINRSHMRSAYFAYLQNTPGSKKAITECVRGLKSGKA